MRQGAGRHGGQTDYRGLEHSWYTVWNCVLVKFCDGSPSLVPCPQRWITRECYDNDGNLTDARLVPDFALQRAFETRSSRRVRSIDSDHRATIIEKIVLLFESKPTPKNPSDAAVAHALLGGRVDLVRQMSYFFAGQEKKKVKYKDRKVIGMYAAGPYWAWEVFTPDQAKPASKNKDATYRPDDEDEEEAPALPQDVRYFKLGTRGSENAMREMLREIYRLPGSEQFPAEEGVFIFEIPRRR